MNSHVADTRAPSMPPAGPKRPSGGAGEVLEYIEPIKELIIKYPSAALASAFLVGVALAWWIKRR
jgi:hypothetical protein